MTDCSKCKYYRPYEVLLGMPDWMCAKYNRYLSPSTIGCNFICDGFEEAEE